MKCEDARRAIDEQFDGDGTLSLNAQAHAAMCEACAAYTRELDTIGGALQALGEEPAPAALVTQVQARVARERTRRRPHALVAAAVLFASAAAGGWWYPLPVDLRSGLQAWGAEVLHVSGAVSPTAIWDTAQDAVAATLQTVSAQVPGVVPDFSGAMAVLVVLSGLLFLSLFNAIEVSRLHDSAGLRRFVTGRRGRGR